MDRNTCPKTMSGNHLFVVEEALHRDIPFRGKKCIACGMVDDSELGKTNPEKRESMK